MDPLVFFTIASRNYLAYALTLMQSVARQYPHAKRFLCLVDERADDPCLDTDLFETVTIEQLDLPHFDAFVFRYDIMELNTAVKPYMFAWLQARNPGVGLVYLDPDLYLVRPLDEISQAFSDGKLAVLTPHINAPLTDDGKFPNELSLMRTGVYNCGFVAINAAHAHAASLIDWWSRKLEFDCFVDLAAGLFTDQKWMDMAPALFPDVEILRHDGYNVAYWNLANRHVVRAGGNQYSVNGVALVFAHFSGVSLSDPGRFSKHQNRFDADAIDGLRPLYDEYLEKLRQNGQLQHATKPYAYGNFADGMRIAPVLRRTYHRCFDVFCAKPELHPQHMDRGRFNAPSEDLPDVAGLPVSCVMHEVWRVRTDLRDSYDLRSQHGREGFVRWYLDNAEVDMGLNRAFIDPVRAQFKPLPRVGNPRRSVRARVGGALLRALSWGKRHGALARLYARLPIDWRLALRRRVHAATGTPMPSLPFPSTGPRMVRTERPALKTPGVNLLGYARGEFGIAENVRSYARALAQEKHPFAIFNFDVGVASRQDDHSMDRYFSETLDYADNVFFINADQMPIARKGLGREAFAGRRNVGFWVWELEKFPHEWHTSFDLVDEIWVPTAFVRNAVGTATDKPVLRMPKAIEFEAPTGMGRAYFGLPPGKFVFLYSYDFNSFVARKNPEAVIDAFKRAFPVALDDVVLVMKSTNGARFPDRLAGIAHAASNDPRIIIRDAFLTREEMFGLQNSVDCYVSLHRAEGFGLGMAECMYLGKPVIATGYSGNLDFMDRDNSLLVDCRMVPVHEGEYPHWQGQQWADADVAHAARLMRQVFDDNELARRVGAAAASSIRKSNSRAACAEAMISRFAEIDRHRTIPGAGAV